MGKHVGWSEIERQLATELIKAVNEGHPNPLKYVANLISMEYSTAKNTLYRMRNRHDAMRDALEEYSKWRRQMRGRRYL